MMFETLFPDKTEHLLSLINGFKIIKHSDNFIEFTYSSNLTNKAQITKFPDNTFEIILFKRNNAVTIGSNVSLDNVIDMLYNNSDCLWGD